MTLFNTMVTTTREKVELRVPTNWGMFTKKGNRRLTQIAQKAYDKIDALKKEKKYCAASDVRKILVAYIASWLKAGRTKSYGEASDTAVRECIGDFHDKLYTAAGYEGHGYDRWEENLEEAYKKARSW